jgi:hypothetical protein
MSTATRRPRPFFIATAALVAFPASTSALLHSHSNAPSSPQPFGGRPAFLKLEATRQSFSGLDKLKAKRLSIRRRIPEPEVEATSDSRDADDLMNDSSIGGLEYLYDAGEERHSDDLYHLILMPS